jgi:SAM-dependent methyltransferase
MYDGAARFYDVIHAGRGRDAAMEAALIVGEVRRRVPQAEALLDVGCGTGAHLPGFAKDFEVVGVDLSPHMLAIAAERAPEVPLVQGDFRSFRLDRSFDVAVSLFSGIGYLLEPEDLQAAIANIGLHLNAGGAMFVEGWVEPDYWIGSTLSAESGRTDDLAVARAVRSQRSGLRCEIVMEYVAVTADETIRVEEHHAMRLSDPEEFATAFSAAGLTAERLPHMLHPGRSVYVGRKR